MNKTSCFEAVTLSALADVIVVVPIGHANSFRD